MPQHGLHRLLLGVGEQELLGELDRGGDVRAVMPSKLHALGQTDLLYIVASAAGQVHPVGVVAEVAQVFVEVACPPTLPDGIQVFGIVYVR